MLEESDQSGVIRVQTTEDQSTVSVPFTDNGRGMDKQTRLAALVAFFTTKDGHRGLGLSAALYVVRKHGGRLQIKSVAGKGTAVRVLLPIDAPDAD